MSLSKRSTAVVLAGLVATAPSCAPRQVTDPDCVAAECARISRPAPAPATITAGELLVDFSLPATRAWAPNGFLLSTQSFSSTNPTLSGLRDRLQIGAWRVGDEAFADTAMRAGIRTTLLLYEPWKRDRRGAWPFQDFSGFEQWLRPIVVRNRDRALVWEIWNEWDLGLPWWAGTDAELLRTYALAERVIRSEAGAAAMVAGPSYNRFDRARFRAFAEYCLAHGCQVNAFTWHELRDQGAGLIADHVRWVKDSIATNPRYAPLRILEIDVNEILSRAERYSTGDLVVALRGLYDGGSAFFARSCWRDATDGEYECLNGSYDGIIDTTTRRPRGAWWVHAAYARIRNAPVTVQSSSTSTAIAGLIGPGTPVGVILASGVGTGDSTLQFTLRGLAALAPPGTPLIVTAYGIPWKQADCALPTLPILFRRSIPPIAGGLQFTLPSLARESITTRGGERLAGRGAYLILVTRSPEPALKTLLGSVEFNADPPCPSDPGRGQ